MTIREKHIRQQTTGFAYSNFNKTFGLNLQKKLYEQSDIVINKITIFWDVTPCGLVDKNQCFEGGHELYLRG